MSIDENTNLEELLRVAGAELEQLRQRSPIRFELKAIDAWALVGNLQLALLHGSNRGASARIGRRIARSLEHALATTPALKEIVRRGWKQQMPRWLGS